MNRNKRTSKRQQPRKDSGKKRVNYDNTRVSKFDKDVDAIKDPKVMKRSSGSNDIAWYTKNPDLLKAAASLPFFEVTGIPFQNYPSLSVPGIMVLDWVPYIGGSLTNPLIQCSNDMYSYVVHANSRNTKYDAPDLMLVVLAGAQIFTKLAEMIRVYGISQNFNEQDNYTPEALITAMGYDYQSVKNNLSQVWFDINRMIAQVNQLWIPNTLPLIQRWFWMNTNVYRDGSSVKSQYYLFRQSVYYKYNETASETGGCLEPIVNVSGNWSEHVNMFETMLTALINSQDRGIIFGDILKAYGAESLYTVNSIPIEYKVVPQYDREVLSQIENCIPYTIDAANVGPVIQYIDTSVLASKTSVPVLRQAFNKGGGDSNVPANKSGTIGSSFYMNFHQLEAPTIEQVMVASRLMSVGEEKGFGYKWLGSTTTSSASTILCAGTEVINHVSVYYMANGTTGSSIQKYSMPTVVPQSTAEDATKATVEAQMMMIYNSFDWCPAIYTITPRSGATWIGSNPTNFGTTNLYAIMDYDNYSCVDHIEINKLHLTAKYSLLGMPQSLR